MSSPVSFVLAGALLALAACTALDGPKPTDHTAVVKDGPWGKVYRGGYVEMASGSGSAADWRLHSAQSIAPGEHAALLYVYLCNGDPEHCIPIAQALVTFNAIAGHSYRPHAQEQVHGSNRFRLWVEDENTGSVVGETAPDLPSS